MLRDTGFAASLDVPVPFGFALAGELAGLWFAPDMSTSSAAYSTTRRRPVSIAAPPTCARACPCPGLDFVPADPAAFKQFARTAKWKLTGPKRAFLVSGEERVGAVAELHRKLAEAKINVTAIDAVCAGAGRYGAILWVAPRDVSKTAKLLGAA